MPLIYTYIESNKIEIFPSTFRGDGYSQSKLTTESNLRSLALISKQIKNNRIFIADPNNVNYSIIIIDGYYFRILNDNIPSNIKYAVIRLRTLSTNSDNTLSLGSVLDNLERTDTGDNANLTVLDNNSYFKGLGFTAASDSEPVLPHVQVRDDAGNLLFQPLRLSTDEIRDNDSDVSIAECLSTKKITKKSNDPVIIDSELKTSENKTLNINDNVSISAPLTIDAGSTTNIKNEVAVKSKVSIDNNSPIDIKTGLKITANGSIQIGTNTDTSDYKLKITRKKGSVNPEIKVPDGTITLLADLPKLSNNNTENNLKILAQPTPGQPEWISYNTENADNSIVMRDANRDIKANSFNNISLADKDLNNKSSLNISDSQNHKITNYASLTINANTNIADATNIISACEIGAENTGKVTIKSVGQNDTTIIGPNNGTATLSNDFTARDDSELIINDNIAINAQKRITINNETQLDNTWITLKKLFEKIYPIGSIYMSTSNSNPAELFGGTWEAWGEGRVPVGVDTNDNNFSTVEKIGGKASHKLTSEEMPSHIHTIPLHEHKMKHTHTIDAHNHTISHTHSIKHSHTINKHSHAVYSCGDWAAHADGLGQQGQEKCTDSTVLSLLGTNMNDTIYNGTRAYIGALSDGGNEYREDRKGYYILGKDNNSNKHSSYIQAVELTTNTVSVESGASSNTNTGNNTAFTTENKEFITDGCVDIGGKSLKTMKTSNAGGKEVEPLKYDNIAHTNLQPYITCYMWKRTAL